MKETENSKLLAENSRNLAQVKRLESENAQLRSEVDNLKESQWADINSPTPSIAIFSGIMQ